ncbi:hypothetical protein PC122_g22547 [Phytophthora cactorum]|nr:hypothetical protein PC122_g22547 [Phytophthora cactorum]
MSGEGSRDEWRAVELIQRFARKPASGVMPRIRSGSRTKQAAEARAVDFGHLWRQLKAAGWESKKPLTRLSNDWRYFVPCADESEFEEGTNWFTGEDAVVSFAIASGLINLHESSEDDGDGERCGAASEQQVGDGVADSRQGEDAGERRGEGDGEERSVDGRQLLKDGIGG